VWEWQGVFWAGCLDFFTAGRPVRRSYHAVGMMATQLFGLYDFLIVTAQDYKSLNFANLTEYILSFLEKVR